ncbi:MAG: sn-glycerol-3-phosphate ABC transporter ATP-binding protein UgpC [Oscillospiraceae bacterium]|nr:sn-glycerol-3-phosphate ABC transporter ATP-binding protein UgpC [Oscillospiraceae bacterium]
MAQVTLAGIQKTYEGGVVAVSDFNLEIADREFIVFVGPSGCGKSTVLRMIAGLEKITGGELFIGGQLSNDVPAKGRDIAMVFQNYALYPHMTVFENMAFSLTIKKLPKSEIRRRVGAAAQILEMSHLLDRFPSALSGGQRQRAALGRALVRSPKVFLFDEPLSNLDARLRANMRAELIRLHRRIQTTFVYVTHDQIEAMTMGDRIVVMKDGVIQQVDTPENLYAKPQNLFVAGFIGTPQMNLFEGALCRREGEVRMIFGDGVTIPLAQPMAERVRDWVGKSVVFGLRPTDMIDDEKTADSHPERAITLDVEREEYVGAERTLYLKRGGLQLTAVIKANVNFDSKVGGSQRIVLDMEKLHMFDPVTERSIL